MKVIISTCCSPPFPLCFFALSQVRKEKTDTEKTQVIYWMNWMTKKNYKLELAMNEKNLKCYNTGVIP